MRDYVTIGCSPSAEDCVQVGDPDYHTKARAECKRFRDLIRKKVGPEPFGALLKIKSFPHDFGSYMEVICEYEGEIEEAEAYAFKCENEAPEHWEEP